MFKLDVFQLDSFLNTVNECSGAVNLLEPDGTKEDLNKNYYAQEDLQQQFVANQSYLRLTLDIPCPKDYMKIVTSSISSC